MSISRSRAESVDSAEASRARNSRAKRPSSGRRASRAPPESARKVDGNGSTWTNGANLYVGRYGSGTLEIANGGLVSVSGLLTIDYDSSDDSFINMSTGGMLALLGDADDSIAAFLDLINGTDAIRYWDDSISDWANITGATYGDDYRLSYLTEGDLAGYTLLTVGTVPEPSIFVMLLALPLVMFWRRRR